MIQIIIASHGPLSEAIVKSASLIAGNEITKNIKHIQITMDTSVTEAKQMVDKALKSFDVNDEILALTDVYGGSITKVITEWANVLDKLYS